MKSEGQAYPNAGEATQGEGWHCEGCDIFEGRQEGEGQLRVRDHALPRRELFIPVRRYKISQGRSESH